jgi:hypothetical protein
LRPHHASRTQDRRRGAGFRAAALLALGLLLLAGAGAAQAEAQQQADGCRITPSIGCVFGEHKLDFFLTTRLRTEFWRALAPSTETLYAARTRVGLEYSFGDLLSLFAEFQDARVYNLTSQSSGAGALYRRFADGRNWADNQSVRQLWLDVKPVEGLGIRIGRQDINLGTEVMYPEANWKYVKIKRASQRLVGTVGWTHAERSNDAVRASYDTQGGGHHLLAFAGQPTTGVFDIEDAYQRQPDITYGGLTWTVKRDTWLPGTELRLFGLVYDDKRDVRDGGLPDSVTVYTGGASLIGFYPVGPGTLDVLAWGAYQFGRFNRLDHSGGAAILETGYQLADVPLQPWLRLGVNYASGDGDPTDGDHQTFFNMLPTNHLYYGFADQWAFQNLVDWFIQLMLRPHEKVGVNLMLHQFYLADDDDARYFGTGAFNKQVFGFGAQDSLGYGGGATEIDAVASYSFNKHLSVQGGYSYMWGRGLFNANRYRNVSFGFLQLTLKY